MNTPARVLVVDDHALFRDMFEATLRARGLEVFSIGETEAAIAIGIELQPTVAVLDIDMPGRSTFEVARTLLARSPATRVVFLSAYVRDGYIEQALAVGASGYLCKSEPLETILDAIDAVAAGSTCYSREVLQRIVIDGSNVRIAEQPVSRTSLLTGREREVLLHVARGLSQRQVADVLGISIKTVQHHLATVMDKLEIHDRVDLARYAIREGCVEP